MTAYATAKVTKWRTKKQRGFRGIHARQDDLVPNYVVGSGSGFGPSGSMFGGDQPAFGGY
jgi:hypothetical protein